MPPTSARCRAGSATSPSACAKNPTGVINCPGQAAKAADDVPRRRRRAASSSRPSAATSSDARLEKLVDFFAGRGSEPALAQATGDLVEVVLNSPDFLFRKELDVGRDAAACSGAAAAGPDLHASPTRRPKQLELDAGHAGQLSAAEHRCRGGGQGHRGLQGGAREARALLQGLARDQGRRRVHHLAAGVPRVHAKAGAGHASRRPTGSCAPSSPSRAPKPQGHHAGHATSSVSQAARAPIYASRSRETRAEAKPVRLDPAPAARHLHAAGGDRLAFRARPARGRSSAACSGCARSCAWRWSRRRRGSTSRSMTSDATTERQRIEQSTKQAACIGCHKMINPFGFFLENYDALGRWRDDGQRPSGRRRHQHRFPRRRRGGGEGRGGPRGRSRRCRCSPTR